MKSVYALLIGALVLANTLPSSAQTSPVPSPTPAPEASTAPFAPPADWVQLPRGFTLTEIKNLWRGPRTGGPAGGGVFGQAVLPIPSGIVAALLVQLRNALAHSKTKLNATTVSTKVCGATASISTVRLSGKKPATIETTTLSQRGLTYATIYIRATSSADPAIESALRTACPLPNGGLPDVTPPRGWNAVQKGLDFELAGIWLGNAPLQMMTMLQARGIPNLAEVANMAPSSTSGSQHQVKYRANVQRVKFCGTPGVLLSAQLIVPPGFGMTYNVAVAQGMDGTFILSYLHPSSYNDPGAQQSLRTLCGGPPPASPSPSPAKP